MGNIIQYTISLIFVVVVVVVVVVDDLLDVDLDLLKIAPCTPHLKAEFLTWIFFPFKTSHSWERCGT